jgi:sirohydrochlorin cobaltochelatase
MYALVLIGHGAAPKGLPRELVRRLKELESQRSIGSPMSAEEAALDHRVRHWPRNAQTDPYMAGVDALARRLQLQLPDTRVIAAYNEFCAPSVPEAVETLVAEGHTKIVLATTMFTPGGVHAEVEIPAAVRELASKYPAVDIRYAWPVDLDLVATLLAEHTRRFADFAS